MDKKINILINKYADNELLLDKFVVTAFAKFNHLEIADGYLVSLLAREEDGLDDDIRLLSAGCSIEDVINSSFARK